jgi:UDP-GlcNAc:undecaprenyl-phosphate/decaprenyl-phosphate GlcNAc-1-phosphate transferase
MTPVSALVVALAVAGILMPVGARIGPRLGLVDWPSGDGLKIHSEPIPVTGGIIVLTVGMGVALAAGVWWGWVALAVAIAAVGGIADDIRPLSAWIRLLAQASAGLILAMGWASDLSLIEMVGLVGLTIACTNAVNIMDGQDGLAGGLSALAAAGLGGLALILELESAATVGLALAGALLGFLLWNRPPATIFLGSGGAYGVGTLFAALVARTYVAGGRVAIPAAGLCLGVFAFELLFTVGRRWRMGRPITVGDRLHSYDLVSERIGRRGSTAAFLAVGATLTLAGVVVIAVPLWWGAAWLGLTLVAIGSLWLPWPSRRAFEDRKPWPWPRSERGTAGPGVRSPE